MVSSFEKDSKKVSVKILSPFNYLLNPLSSERINIQLLPGMTLHKSPNLQVFFIPYQSRDGHFLSGQTGVSNTGPDFRI